MKFATRYEPHPPRAFATHPVGESMTNQQFKEECDVNNILAKYRKTGLVTHLAKHQGNFGDFSTLEDYQTSLEKILKAEESFRSLPSELRSKFENDPGKLIEYLSNKENDEEAIKFGLKVRPPAAPPDIGEQMAQALEKNDLKREERAKQKKD